MAILKCKMCGGDIILNEEKTFGTCKYCGSTMTLPKVSDDQRANMFNRGNHFRRMGEFDKALAVYERIVQEDENDAEAHWCCALCRFGIEYVEDPSTFEYLPTCHRASFDSFLEDVDYLAALEHSDGITRRQYQKDAVKIAEVQRGILATSQNEEPFDVFICYKESENDGSRTRDSLYAQDIYYQLTEQGRRVFFSRITLEDKVGTDYEPYIFAALNSAKVMIVVTTSAEHANSVWVKNEWSRFLSLMRQDRSKLLLPCYRDMDPYDLPEALSVLQSYDMSKIGFIQDLIRGVNKVLEGSKPKQTTKETVMVQQQSNNAAPLLERAFMFLEDGNWVKADEFCEQVLNLEPKNALAYLGKLMAELHIKTQDALKDSQEPFDNHANYQKAMRFGDKKLKSKLSDDIAFITERNENARKLAEQKAEAKNRRIMAVARALKKSDKTTVGPTLEERLAEANAKIGNLERILNVFDPTQKQIKALQSELNGAILKEKQLSEQRSHLGLFAGKERKRIDEELEAVSAKKSDLTTRINQQQNTISSYVSLASVKHDLNEVRKKAADIENQIESVRANTSEEYSFDEANSIYLSEPDIAAEVNNIYPAARFIPVIQGRANSALFGRYNQKGNDSPEPIEWQVLAREKGRILLISKYALDILKFDNSTYSNVTWETCSLRKWLNGTFLNTAFTPAEQNCILNTTVTADKNPLNGRLPGRNTTDKVFLLSITEVNKYFTSDSARQCQRAQKAYGNFNWWLRTPGYLSNSATKVNSDGSVDGLGDHIRVEACVRPALWVNLGA